MAKDQEAIPEEHADELIAGRELGLFEPDWVRPAVLASPLTGVPFYIPESNPETHEPAIPDGEGQGGNDNESSQTT